MELEGKNVVTIYSGEYYISNEPQTVIYTLLGSCIAVCLYDEVNGIGGMNHFMLPQAEEYFSGAFGHFGLQSLESMIEKLLIQGAVYRNLKAKIFGGGNVLGFNYNENDVAGANINFALNYLKSKKIPIIAKELGGTSGRKIYYVLEDHSVYVQRLNKGESNCDGPKPYKQR